MSLLPFSHIAINIFLMSLLHFTKWQLSCNLHLLFCFFQFHTSLGSFKSCFPQLRPELLVMSRQVVNLCLQVQRGVIVADQVLCFYCLQIRKFIYGLTSVKQKQYNVIDGFYLLCTNPSTWYLFWTNTSIGNMFWTNPSIGNLFYTNP